MFYSCRDLAYDQSMPHIVTLIDFYNENTNKKIVKYIGRNLLKENEVRHKNHVKLLDRKRLLEKRLVETFIKKDSKENEMIKEELPAANRTINSVNSDDTDESLLYDEIDMAKPLSSFKNTDNVTKSRTSINDKSSRNSYLTRSALDESDSNSEDDRNMEETLNDSEIASLIDLPKLMEMDTERDIDLNKKSNENIVKRLQEKSGPLPPIDTVPTRKELTYRGYKIQFNVDIVDGKESVKPTVTKHSRVVIKKSDESPRPKSQNRPRSTVMSQLSLRKTPVTPSYSRMQQRQSQLNNYANNSEYLSVFNNINETSVQSRPTTSISTMNNYPQKLKSSMKQLNTTNNPRNTSKSSFAIIHKPVNNNDNDVKSSKEIKRSNTSFKETYLKALKRSGLCNDYCTPIIRPKQHITGVIAAK